MKIAGNQYPPNFDEIKERFGLSGFERVVFAYGDTLYNPLDFDISDNLRVHEETHMRQQGDKPYEWWVKYMKEDEFRKSQEAEAYQNQYQFFTQTHKDRNEQIRFLYHISRDFATYYDLDLTRDEAARIIKFGTQKIL